MRKILVGAILVFVCFSCSRQQYVVSNIAAQRYPVAKSETMNGRNAEVGKIVGKYKHLLDKEMNLVIGHAPQAMRYGRPESLLTNFTSDAMLDYTRRVVGKNCDLALMNVNGHRSNMPKGDIRVGDIYEIYSFENALVLVQLKGSDLIDVFRSYAKLGGAGISSTARLVIKDGQLYDAKIEGRPVDKDKIYTLVTLDYLVDGNDGMEDLKKAIDARPLGITLRDVIFQHIEEETKQGRQITSQLDGRISIEK